MRRSTLGVLAVLVCALVAGCAGTEQGTFVAYGTKIVGYKDLKPLLGGKSTSIFGPAPTKTAVREPDGSATITLRSGVQVKASCSIVNLKPGDTVTVKDVGNGKWAVLSRP